MTDQPRLFADYAALPTARDRALRRANAERHQLELLTPELAEPRPATACPVCAGVHIATDCPHGTAPELPSRSTHPGRWIRMDLLEHTDEFWHTNPEGERGPDHHVWIAYRGLTHATTTHDPAQVRAMFRGLGWPTTGD